MVRGGQLLYYCMVRGGQLLYYCMVRGGQLLYGQLLYGQGWSLIVGSYCCVLSGLVRAAHLFLCGLFLRSQQHRDAHACCSVCTWHLRDKSCRKRSWQYMGRLVHAVIHGNISNLYGGTASNSAGADTSALTTCSTVCLSYCFAATYLRRTI